MSFDMKLRAELIAAAKDVAQRAYCPYSHFHVGAAVVSGHNIFTGCNVENASYGLAICAERVAISKMISAGYQTIDAIAVSCADADELAPESSRVPCGACRQFIAEFAQPNTPIFVVGGKDYQLHELLPTPFG